MLPGGINLAEVGKFVKKLEATLDTLTIEVGKLRRDVEVMKSYILTNNKPNATIEAENASLTSCNLKRESIQGGHSSLVGKHFKGTLR